MPIRLLLFIPTLDQSGAEKQLTLLATGLPKNEFEVHVGVLTRTGPLESILREHNIPVHLINKRGKLDPWALSRTRKLIRELKPDIVHTWLFAANSYGRYAAIREKVPVVIGGERCVDPWKRSYEFRIDRFLAARSNAILTNSTGVAAFYHKHGVPAEKFVVIPNGISPQPTDRLAARTQLLNLCKLPSNVRLAGTVARLWHQKRVDDMIWATDLVSCVEKNFHLVIIGDGPLRAKLERFAEQCRVDDRVHFLGHRNDAAQLLPGLDLFWLTSEYEGQSNSLMEAMASEVPCVVTDIPGNRDLVSDGETGLLSGVGDRARLAKLTLRILENESLANQLGNNAKLRIETEFSLAKMISRHADTYKRLLSATQR